MRNRLEIKDPAPVARLTYGPANEGPEEQGYRHDQCCDSVDLTISVSGYQLEHADGGDRVQTRATDALEGTEDDTDPGFPISSNKATRVASLGAQHTAR